MTEREEALAEFAETIDGFGSGVPCRQPYCETEPEGLRAGEGLKKACVVSLIDLT